MPVCARVSLCLLEHVCVHVFLFVSMCMYVCVFICVLCVCVSCASSPAAGLFKV